MEHKTKYTIVASLAVAFLLLLGIGGQHSEILSFNTLTGNGTDVSNEAIIGLAGPVERLETYTYYFEGVQMAVDEINSEGGILGVPLRTEIRDDGDDVTSALDAAQEFADNPNIHAVVGHWSSAATIAVAQTYELSEKVLIAPVATAPELTELGYSHVFRGTTTDKGIAQRVADYAMERGYNKLAVYYDETTSGKIQSKAFEKICNEVGIEVIDRHGIFSNEDDFEMSYKKWMYRDMDAVFIAGTVTNCENVINWIRERNPVQVILGADGFDVDYFKDILADHSEHIIYTSLLNNSSDNVVYEGFVEAFKLRYGHEPDYWAVKAYDCIYLIKEAMEAAGTVESGNAIRDALLENVNYEGVNGAYSFNENGDMSENHIALKFVDSNAYQYIYSVE